MRVVLENVSVIIAVEGPSAAGKTTWCHRHASEVVEEYVPTGAEPDGTDMSAQAAYWTHVNSRRWSQAVALEARTGLAICDSDPLKLHYSWCLSRIGAAPWARFRHELAAVRQAFLAGALGLADLALVSIPPLEVLRAQRLADPTRPRRSFELHARLGDHLHAWYQAVDAVEPGRVLWQLPDDGPPSRTPPPRSDRSDVALLDALVTSLPSR